MKLLARMAAAIAIFTAPALAQDHPPLLSAAESQAIASEVSGSAALRTVRALSLHHRMRGSEGYRASAELIRDRLRDYGLQGVEIIPLPADGRIFYGTQRSRPAWNARFAELWEQRRDGEAWTDAERVSSWADQPISLAQDSVSGRREAELIDVGAGTSASDYEGRDVRGRLVLASAQPEAVADLAIGRHGAAGIVSWAQNQRTAWWGEDDSLIRWGHLATFGEHPTFAFMASPARARAWQERLRRGETVRLRAQVDAGREAGAYLVPTAVIRGRDPSREIVFPATSIIPRRGPTTMPAAAPASWRSPGRCRPWSQAAVCRRPSEASASSDRPRSRGRSRSSTVGASSPGERSLPSTSI